MDRYENEKARSEEKYDGFEPKSDRPFQSGYSQQKHDEFEQEREGVGRRVGSQVGRMADSAGRKFDSAMDQFEATAQSVKQSYQAMTDEGWEGFKRKAIEYTRKEPLNALLLAIGAGILVGWSTRRAR